MEILKWECFDKFVKSDLYEVLDSGPLLGPVTGFAITRDDDLQLSLETTAQAHHPDYGNQLPAGTVFFPTDKVTLKGADGSTAVAYGVLRRGFKTSAGIKDSSKTESTETSSIHSLEWTSPEGTEPSYVIEWLENMSHSFIWPHSVDDTDTSGAKRTFTDRTFEIVASSSTEGFSGSNCCVHITVDGWDLFVGTSDVKADNVLKPGFVLYKGAPSEEIRAKIRDCLGFCLGVNLVYLGFTSFSNEWHPTTLKAISANSPVHDVRRVVTMPPAPLGNKIEQMIVPGMLERMVNSLVANYENLGLQKVLWAYWHAATAPLHMAAVHFGAALEALQRAYAKQLGVKFTTTILADEAWAPLSKQIALCISETQASAPDKTMLQNKANSLNYAPGGIQMKRFWDAVGIQAGIVEEKAWEQRNKAAHGGEMKPDAYISAIRRTKALRVLMNRIILAATKGSDFYYDYYTIGHPKVAISNPIADDITGAAK